MLFLVWVAGVCSKKQSERRGVVREWTSRGRGAKKRGEAKGLREPMMKRKDRKMENKQREMFTYERRDKGK